jgi:hypothetical protein
MYHERFVTPKRNSYADLTTSNAPVAADVVVVVVVAISPKYPFDNVDMYHVHPTTPSHIVHGTNVCSRVA